MSYGIVLNRNRPDYSGSDGPPRLEGTPDAGRVAAVVNEIALLSLGATEYIHFCGVSYRVRPVPFEAGVRLQQFWLRMNALRTLPTSEQVGQYAALLREIVACFRSLLEPARAGHRLLWRLGLPRRPFRNASEGEIGELLGFFSERRTKSRVRLAALPVFHGSMS